MMARPAQLVILALLLVVAACGVSPVPTPSPSTTITPTPVAPSARPTPTIDPTPTPELTLRVDGMATVAVDGMRQVFDPAHPNQNRRLNAQLGTIDAGERVFLVATLVARKGTYWQVYREAHRTGPLGWVSEAKDANLTLAPFQPACPTNFPLTAEEIQELGRIAVLSCFGQTELMLSGTVNCDRPSIEWAVGGAAFLDANRSCRLDEQIELHGEGITSLLDLPTRVSSLSGRFLVRGHFDDPEAQNCGSIPFETFPNPANQPPEPATIMACRQMFVVSNATQLD